MTTQQTGGPAGNIPVWTRGDRLRKARTSSGMTTREFADRIGVAQKTVTDAENDKRQTVRKIVLNAWSLATGVPVEWLESGQAPDHDGPGPDGVKLPRLDSNQQPSDFTYSQVSSLRAA